MRLPRLASPLILVLALGLSATPAVASTIVVPNFNTSNVGNALDGTDPGSFTARVQQMFGPGQFASIGSPIAIDQMAFRAVPGTGGLTTAADLVDIYLSTSPRLPNLNGGPAALMSMTFADNVGPDSTVVYHGPLAWSTPGCQAVPTCPFDLTLSFQRPFFYNRLQGSLLLDLFVTNLHGSGPGSTDAVDFGQNNPPYGSIASIIGFIGDTTALNFDAGGDITQFRYTALPEPATMTLVLSGLGAAAAARRRRKS